MVLNGETVWSKDLVGSSRCRAQLKRLQRLIAIGIAPGYRTILYEAATVLARFPPFKILADMDTIDYEDARKGRG